MLEDCGSVMLRFSGNDFGPVGAEKVAAALRALTALQYFDLTCTFLHNWLMRGIWFVEENIKYTGNSLKGVLEVLGFIVILIAGSELGPVGGEHVAAALISLTGLTRLGLCGTFLRDGLMRGFWFVEEREMLFCL